MRTLGVRRVWREVPDDPCRATPAHRARPMPRGVCRTSPQTLGFLDALPRVAGAVSALQFDFCDEWRNLVDWRVGEAWRRRGVYQSDSLGGSMFFGSAGRFGPLC
jgi:hypothetical protein